MVTELPTVNTANTTTPRTARTTTVITTTMFTHARTGNITVAAVPRSTNILTFSTLSSLFASFAPTVVTVSPHSAATTDKGVSDSFDTPLQTGLMSTFAETTPFEARSVSKIMSPVQSSTSMEVSNVHLGSGTTDATTVAFDPATGDSTTVPIAVTSSQNRSTADATQGHQILFSSSALSSERGLPVTDHRHATTSDFPRVSGSTPFVLPSNAMSIHVCDGYPCSSARSVVSVRNGTLYLSANATMVIATEIGLPQLLTPAVSVSFVYQLVKVNLSTTTPDVVWQLQTTSAVVAVPALTVSAIWTDQPLRLKVVASFSEGSLARAAVNTIFFVPPPSLHSIDVVALSGQHTNTILQQYFVSVNASNAHRGIAKSLSCSFFCTGYDAFSDRVWTLPVGSQNGLSATVTVPRNFGSVTIRVVVSNEFKSSTSCGTGTILCPTVRPGNLSTQNPLDVLVEIVHMAQNVSSQADSAVLFLAGVHAASEGVENNASTEEVTEHVEELLETFIELLVSDDAPSAIVLQQNIELLSAFATLINDGSLAARASNVSQLIMTGLVATSGALNSGSTAVALAPEVVEGLLIAVDDFVGFGAVASSDYAPLDSIVNSSCNSIMTGSLPGDERVFVNRNTAVSCSVLGPGDPEDQAKTRIDTGIGVTVFVANSGNTSFSVVSVATWDFGNTDDEVLTDDHLLSNAVSIAVAPGTDASSGTNGDLSNGGFEVALGLSDSNSSTALRTSLMCSYWEDGRWSQRGVVLLGFEVMAAKGTREGIEAVALCLSSHLSLFALSDESVLIETFDSKFTTLAQRVSELQQVDLFSEDTQVTLPIPLFFAAVTAVFLVTIVVTKVRARKTAAAEARRIFQRFGVLERPMVLGVHEVDAIVRGYTTSREAWTLVALDVLTINPLLAPFFKWSHEAIVYNRSDKAFIIYSQIMVSSIVMAMFLEFNAVEVDTQPEVGIALGNFKQANASFPSFDNETAAPDQGEMVDLASFSHTLLNVFVQSIIAQVLLAPIKFLLPFMVSNVNSIQSAAGDATRGVFAQISHLISTSRSVGKRSSSLPSGSVWQADTPLGRQYSSMDSRREGSRRVQEFVVLQWRQLMKRKTTFRRAFIKTRAAAAFGQASTRSKMKIHPIQVENLATESLSDVEVIALRKTLRFGGENGCLVKVPKPSQTPSLKEGAFLALQAGELSLAQNSFQSNRDIVRSLHGPKLKTTATDNALLDGGDVTSVNIDTEAIAKLQRKIQLRIRLRQAGRAYEFDVWHVECKALRNGLKTINILFLLIVAAFTFTICLLLSATFTEAEALMWVVGVVQSLVMQICVTDLLVSCGVIAAKLFLSWAVIQCRKPALQRLKQAKLKRAARQVRRRREKQEQVDRIRVAMQIAKGIETKLSGEVREPEGCESDVRTRHQRNDYDAMHSVASIGQDSNQGSEKQLLSISEPLSAKRRTKKSRNRCVTRTKATSKPRSCRKSGGVLPVSAGTGRKSSRNPRQRRRRGQSSKNAASSEKLTQSMAKLKDVPSNAIADATVRPAFFCNLIGNVLRVTIVRGG
eukprot:INCI4813.4.p1 GENE.INCI4813.4~~INCI4813.4.p1  ORF type:complete len:1544 (+),score=268.49 INCI4813.4:5299-9930(+)